MCRLALYIGPPILIADFVLKPSRSIIKVSSAQISRSPPFLPAPLLPFPLL